MPVSGVRVTMFFQDDNFGISETHVYNSLVDLATVVPFAIALYKARMKIMGAGVLPIGCRLSKEGVFRDSMVLDATDLVGLAPANFNYATNTGGTVPNDTDQAKACVLLRLEAGALHRKSLYLAGVPDAVIRENPRGPAIIQIPQWLTDFNTWKGILLNGSWGFVARTDAAGAFASRPVIAVQQQLATGLVQIITTNVGVAFTVGQKVQTRLFTRKNKAFKSLNGVWQVASFDSGPATGQVTYTLLGTAGIDVTTIVNMGTVQAVDFSVFSYSNVQIIGQTTRKRGNRFLAPPGRRRVLVPVSL